MKAVIYCRVSTKEQTENYSLTSQEKACREYCRSKGIHVEKVFTEEGESAKTTDRPRFQEMLDYCRLNKSSLDYVVVYAVSRFARSAYDHQTTRTFLAKLGIALRSVTEPIDDSPMGKFSESISAAYAQLDNDIRAERTVLGMRAALEAGRWPWKAPVGYRNIEPVANEPNLVPDPAKADFVRQAFALYAESNCSMREVLDRLSQLGFTTERRKHFTPQSLMNVLRNPLYTGWMLVPDWNIRSRGTFEPLISEELFQRVQNKMAGKSVTSVQRNKLNPDFPLRVFVRCADCQVPLTGSFSQGRSAKYGYYFCRNTKCKTVKVAKDKLERQFVAHLERLQWKPDYLRLFKAIVLDLWNRKAKDVEDALARANNRLQELHEHRNLLVDALLCKRVTAAVYEARMDKLEQEIALAHMAVQDSKLEQLDVEAVIAFAEHLLGNTARLWLDSPVEQKTQLQRVLFPTGISYSMTYGFGTEPSSSIFNTLGEFTPDKSSLASPTGFEPVLPP